MEATQVKPLEWSELWDAMKTNPNEWTRTTEKMYWDMLECLPPRAMAGGAFLVGEAENHNSQGEAVYAGFQELKNGTFWAKYLTVRQFKQHIAMHKGRVDE